MFDDIEPRNRKHKENDNVRRHENGRQGEGARSYENYDSLGLDHELSRCHLTLQRPVCILVKFGVFFIFRGPPRDQKNAKLDMANHGRHQFSDVLSQTKFFFALNTFATDLGDAPLNRFDR